MNRYDWALIRSFLAVARTGSLSAAARELGVSQPTLSRDVQALETATALNLFKRTTQGLQLTEAGHALMDSATRMDDAADQFARQASGLSVEVHGDVRISANEIVGMYLLPPALAALREQHPGVFVEIVISNHASSLSKREADIALRMFQPTQPDLIARRLPDLELGFFAHRAYLQKHGTPKTFAELQQHGLIGFDANNDFIDGAAIMGYQFVRNNFALRTDHLLTQINLLRAGAGFVATHARLAAQWPHLQRILDWVPLPPLEFWVVCHHDVRFNTRIHAVMQFLTAWFKDDPYQHALF